MSSHGKFCRSAKCSINNKLLVETINKKRVGKAAFCRMMVNKIVPALCCVSDNFHFIFIESRNQTETPTWPNSTFLFLAPYT